MKTIDICNISKYVKGVKGIKGINTSSSTDKWIISFKNTDTGGFLKIFLNYCIVGYDNPQPCMYMPCLDENLCQYNTLSTLSLRYELNIYKKVIDPILNFNISPNFIKPISNGYCDFKTLLDILISSGMSVGEANKKLKRNISNILSHAKYKSTKKKSSTGKIDLKQFKFGIIMNEAINPKNTITLSQLLMKWKNITKHMPSFMGILFQVFCACKVMSLSKLVHNDLHLGNIYVKKLNKPEIITYIFSNEFGDVVKYTLLNQMYKIFIYDFDRSWCERLGKNLFIENKCKKVSQCNFFIENKDIIKVLCYITKRYANIPTPKGFVPFITDNKYLQNYWYNIYTCCKKCFLRDSNQITVPINKYKQSFSSIKIIQNFAQYMKSNNFNLEINSPKLITKENKVYTALDSYFNHDGSIINFRKNIFKKVLERLNNDIPKIIIKMEEYLNSGNRKNNYLEIYPSIVSNKWFDIIYTLILKSIQQNNLHCNISDITTKILFNSKTILVKRIKKYFNSTDYTVLNRSLIKSVIRNIKRIICKYFTFYQTNYVQENLIYNSIINKIYSNNNNLTILKHKLDNKYNFQVNKKLNQIFNNEKYSLIINIINFTIKEICN